MSELPQSPARKTLRRQVAVVWGSLQALWLVFGALLCAPLVSLASPWQLLLVAVGLGAVALFCWRMGVRAVDRLVGVMLDRLAQIAQSTASLDPLTGMRLPSLVSETAGTALGQLAGRLEEAQDGLRAQVAQLSALNRELAATREEWLRAERLAVVGRLAAGIAHEIGNPLGALIGFIGLVKGSLDPETRDQALAGIEGQAQRIHRTLQELMDFARAGKMELAPTALPAAIESAVRLVKVHPRWRHMQLAIALPAALSPVQASEHHLVQVLVNLLLNAADACGGAGSVRLSVTARTEAWLRLAVEDDGPGIPRGEEERIFEPFVSSKPVGQGTGLGLAISRQLVESFGGKIRAVQGEGGARFEIDLPSTVPA